MLRWAFSRPCSRFRHPRANGSPPRGELPFTQGWRNLLQGLERLGLGSLSVTSPASYVSCCLGFVAVACAAGQSPFEGCMPSKAATVASKATTMCGAHCLLRFVTGLAIRGLRAKKGSYSAWSLLFAVICDGISIVSSISDHLFIY